jgi:uncharacterized protein GlcG (DUF336 family)
MQHVIIRLSLALLSGAGLPAAAIAQASDCPVTHEELTQALRDSVKPAGGPGNGGLGNHEWAAVVTRTGTICAVTYSGTELTDQWLGSRGIAAEKANAANAFSLANFALSTANLYAGVQPGGYLYGTLQTNPPRPELLYAGDPSTYGTPEDPLVGEVLGGVVAFGGGLPLYDPENNLVGAVGVSGDTSCADHNVAWRVREKLDLAAVPAGVAPGGDDAILFDIRPNGKSASGYGHVMCGNNEASVAVEIGAGFIPEWKQAAK